MFLRNIQLQREKVTSFSTYPFSIPAIHQLNGIELNKPVTFFIGENGTGKSTLLEAIADKCDFNTAGGGRNNVYDVDASESALGEYIRLAWLPKVTNGFFLRAESFYHFATHLDQIETGALEPYRAYGGKSLHHQSHGESFLSLFLNRFNGGAIYLLDEPEAALSPNRQFTFLRILHDLTKKGDCQFIIATHSPILLGYPDATILSFDNGKIEQVKYEETDHYRVTKYFLQHREKFLEELFAEEE
ncbi:AAA family ATPase [Gracilibacillus oryzae]|uniref:AAA family ATPase n=1 Tax=Gracilibacillus oryzae TaxID=1672701 RepID=A0A7C8GU11_9BACI|nr:AAA family ATPase [Gracilibacillus oryzae]KAB8135787.1 AAA family ATPase [Gracilibacillus oryzae]